MTLVCVAGLASEAYISLSSEDPILTSFELRNELLCVSAAEKYYTVSTNTRNKEHCEYQIQEIN